MPGIAYSVLSKVFEILANEGLSPLFCGVCHCEAVRPRQSPTGGDCFSLIRHLADKIRNDKCEIYNVKYQYCRDGGMVIRGGSKNLWSQGREGSNYINRI